jgi:DNA ligase-1
MAAPKPMLAPNEQVDFDDPRIPKRVLVSDKLDGMRVLAIDGTLYSRNLKPLRKEIQDRWKDFLRLSDEHGLVFDGEIFEYGNPDFGSLMSKISRGGADVPDTLKIHVFDCVRRSQWASKESHPFYARVQLLTLALTESKEFDLTRVARSSGVVPLQQREVVSPQELEREMTEALARGTEGLIARDPNGRYKHGRGTLNEGLIFKFKEWVTQDGRITGFNQATAMTDEYRESDRGKDVFGHRERSHKQETRELVEGIGSYEITLADGRVIGAGVKKGVTLPITWENRDSFRGKWAEVEFMEHGAKDKPRFSRIKRLRPDLDL